jgi:cation transport ATPase
VLTVDGICCPSEVPIIQNSLKGLPGVVRISVNVPAKTTTVEYDADKATPDQFVAALNSVHLGARVRRYRLSACSSRSSPPNRCLLTLTLSTHLHLSKFKVPRAVMTVDGICCPSEVPIIQNSLKGLTGVSDVSVNVPGKTTTVEYDASKIDPEQFVAALNRANLGACLRSNETPQDGDASLWKQLPHWNILLAFTFLVVAIPSVSSNEDLAFMKYFALVSIALAWPPILRKAVGALRVHVLDINCLMTIAIIAGAIVIEEYLEGAGLVTLFALSEWLERLVTDRARKAFSNTIALKPENAQLLNGDVVPVEDVDIGTLLEIKPGEKAPVDGVVRKGVSSVDGSSITGEARPVGKKEGDTVCSGTINNISTRPKTTKRDILEFRLPP